MRSTPLLIEATPAGGYAVHVRFEDSTSADVDLSYLLDYGGIFEPLRDPEYFRQLKADRDAGTIVWPNEADVAPETLYAHAQRRGHVGAGLEGVFVVEAGDLGDDAGHVDPRRR